MNILVLSAGTRNKIIQYFKKELSGSGDKVIATDMSNFAPSIYEADKFYIVPKMTENKYLDCILDICKKEKIDNKNYLDVFQKDEDSLSDCEIYKSCAYDIKSAKYLDIEKIKAKRRENALFLKKRLKDIAIFKKLKKEDCPLFVPIIIKNRNGLKKYLIENDVFCPVHWEKSKLIKMTKDDCLYTDELSLICDQRYSLSDMEKIVQLIKQWRELNA